MSAPYEYLVDAVCEQFGITPVQLRAGNRQRENVEARRILVHALAAQGCGPLQGGRIIARDHSTFIHHRDKTLGKADAETLLDAQRAAARRWAVNREAHLERIKRRRAAARKRG